MVKMMIENPNREVEPKGYYVYVPYFNNRAEAYIEVSDADEEY